MLAKTKRILKLGILLGFMLFVCTQVLNVRSPITIETAKATNGTIRVLGHANYSWYGSSGALPNVNVTMTKPDGSKLYTTTNSYGYFEFTGTVETLPDGNYNIKAEKPWFNTVSKSFTMEPYHGAEATITMIPFWGGSWIGIVPFFPWY